MVANFNMDEDSDRTEFLRKYDTREEQYRQLLSAVMFDLTDVREGRLPVDDTLETIIRIVRKEIGL